MNPRKKNHNIAIFILVQNPLPYIHPLTPKELSSTIINYRITKMLLKLITNLEFFTFTHKLFTFTHKLEGFLKLTYNSRVLTSSPTTNQWFFSSPTMKPSYPKKLFKRFKHLHLYSFKGLLCKFIFTKALK